MKTLKNNKLLLIIFVIALGLLFVGNVFYGGPSSTAFANGNIRDGYSVEDIREMLEESSDFMDLEIYAQDGTMDKIQVPSNAPDEQTSRSNVQTNATFDEQILITSKKPESQSIVMTIMGDGFTDTQQTDFIAAAESVVEFMLGNPATGATGFYPFNLFRDVFTVYAIEVISDESGVSRDVDEADYDAENDENNPQVNNYFGSTFYGFNHIERALVITEYSRAEELVKPGSSMSAILCNSTRWGGTGGTFAVTSLADTGSTNNYRRIMTHEFGHSFGHLADEYYYDTDGDGTFNGREAANMTANSDAATIKWSAWIGFQNVGIFPYSITYNTADPNFTIDHPNFDPESNNWFKPHQNCHMQYSSSDFCPVCAAELIRLLELKVGALFNTTELDNNNIRIDMLNIPISGTFEIPVRIGGRVVSEIGASAFANQSECNEIIIPPAVVSIGNQAFKNCSSLATISSIPNIQTIGSEAFKGCSSLNYIYLPSSLVSIGTQAFAKCYNLNINISSSNTNYSSQGKILYNKAKTQLIAACNISSDITIPNTVTEIISYAFEENIHLTKLHFPQSPSIGDFAFANCSNLSEVYFDSYSLPTLGTSCFIDNNFTLYTPYITRETYGIAFAAYTTNLNSIAADISFVSDSAVIDTQYVNYGSIIANLAQPVKTGYEFLGWYDSPIYTGTQYENGDLWETKTDLTLYAKWTPKQYYISFAGEQSSYLEGKLVTFDAPIGELPVIARIGYTFLGWKAPNGQYYNANTIYAEDNNLTLTSDWSANNYVITYNGNGGTASEYEQDVTFDAVVNTLATCTRTGYFLMGWNTALNGSGQTISSPFVYTNSTDITLYAQWQIIEYSITYNLDGGTNTSNPSSYTIISDDIVFNAPNKVGYTFVNWKNYESIVTGIPSGSYGNLTITAYWAANQYTVTLHPNEGNINGNSTFIVTYNSSFSTLTIPTKDGYTFEGWYDSDDIKYMTAAGVGTRLWDKAVDTTLYAKWAIKSYEIQINNNGTITWLGGNGLSSVPCSIEYGTILNSFNLIASYKQSVQGYKEGKIFDHFEYGGITVTWESVPDLGDNGAFITIIPIWVLELHTIYFNTLSSLTFESIVTNYDESIILPSNAARDGYTFSGWYSSTNGGTRIQWTTMPDLTLGIQNNGSITLFAQYSLIQYTVSYNLDGGVNAANNPIAYNFENIITLHQPTKTGYQFGGWYLDIEKTQPIIELRNSFGNKQLYAEWTPNNYTIRYNMNGGTGTLQESTHTYNVVRNLSVNTYTRNGYHFIGWATSQSGAVAYANSAAVVNLTAQNNAMVNIYAKWEANTYTVNYLPNGGQGSMSPSTHTYDVSKTLNNNTFTRTGYSFGGWATSAPGSVAYNNMQSVTNLTATQNGSVSLYVKWNPNTYTVTFDKQSGSGGTNSISVVYNSAMPSATAPTRTGYTFQGYYSQQNGGGIKYYNANMTSANNWITAGGATLYAKWSVINYAITYNLNGGQHATEYPSTYTIEDNITFANPYKKGYRGIWDITSISQGSTGNKTITAQWTPYNLAVNTAMFLTSGGVLGMSDKTYSYSYGDTLTLTAMDDISTYKFVYWKLGDSIYSYNRTITLSLSDYNSYTIFLGYSQDPEHNHYALEKFQPYYEEKSCISSGSQITLSDGSQKSVETLTGNEELLVWDLLTGTFDAAPILFIDSDPYTAYEIIHLYFSDGTEVKVISEHGFWDINLNEYVFLSNDAVQYIGHWFNKQIFDGNGNMLWTAVQLIDVDIYMEHTTAWSPVAFDHLCYYVNGMLSMPGATEGLINIFEVDAVTMKYNAASFAADITTYGLFTYEEFAEIIPIPEVIFEAFNGQYLKVSIGKGLIDMEGLIALIERYADFFTEEDIDTSGNENVQGNGNHNGHCSGHHNNSHHNGNGNHNGHGNGNQNGHRGRGR